MAWSRFRRLAAMVRDALHGGWHRLGLALFLALVDLAFLISLPLLGAEALDALLQGHKQVFSRHLLRLAALAVAQAGIAAAVACLVVAIQEDWGHNARSRVMGHLLQRPLHFLERRPAGDLLARVLQDTASLKTVPTALMLQWAVDGITVATIATLMLGRHPLLAALALACAPLPLCAPWLARRRIERLSHRVRLTQGNLAANTQHWLSRPLSMKAHRLEVPAWRLFQQTSRHLARALTRMGRMAAAVQACMVLIQQAPGLFILSAGSAMVVHGQAGPGDLLAFLGLAALLETPLQRLLAAGVTLPALWPPARRLRPFWEAPAILHGPRPAAVAIPSAWCLEVNGLQVARPAHGKPRWRLVVDSMRARRGYLTGISGPPGSGKSTLARCLAGLMRPHRGAVQVLDRQGGRHPVEAISSRMGFMPQQNALYRSTLLDNVTLFEAQPDRRQALAALRHAGLSQWLEDQHQGLDAFCGDDSMLSGGQQRLLALARLLYLRPCVWILDEPELHLDPGGRLHFGSVLEDMARQHIIVLMTHDAHLLKRCRSVHTLPLPLGPTPPAAA